MFVENLDKIDESLHDQFIEHEKDGVKGFIDKDSKTALDMAFHIKEEKKTYLEKLKAVGSELDNYKATEAERIENAKKEALEKAKSSGEIESIERIYEEKMVDLEKRTAERVRQEVQQEYTLKEVQNKAKLELNEIVHALKPKDEFAKRLIEDHLRTRQKVEEGRIIYTNDDGSASTLDYKGLIGELQESPMFKPLSSYTPPASGGGLINGSKGGSAPVAKNDVKANLEKRLKQQGLQ